MAAQERPEPDALEDRFVGSLLGLALGDALGARHEGGPIGQAAWWLLGLGKGDLLRWSDDTEMALGLAASLVEKGGVDADHLARTWAEGMSATRGYGSGARRLLTMIRAGADWRDANCAIFPDGSFGNGAAMRAAPLGLFYHREPAELDRAARRAAEITHAHPLGIEGGVLIARATAMALAGNLDLDALRDGCREDEFRDLLTIAMRDLDRDAVVRRLGNGIEAHRSAVTAVHVAHRFREFLPMIEFIISLGGDTDTIGAMAGGIFGARHGTAALPAEPLARLEERELIEKRARELWAAIRLRGPAGDATA
jgi:poly(ADP-ribose) glycohydrolase ARH3